LSESEYDVVVIGGGVSGLMAAICLAGKGCHVAVVSQGDPVACLSTGCVDLLALGDHPLELIASLPDRHPYRMVARSEILNAFDLFKEATALAGLDYIGSPDQNRGILTPLGTIKTTCLVPDTMRCSPAKRDEYLHIISFDGLKDFYPSYIQARFRHADFSLYEAGVSSTMSLAQQFEMEAFRAGFISWLKSIDITGEKVGLPAVLGLEDPSSVRREIESQIDRPVFEIPTLPPSVPGIRLFRALKRRLQKSGGELYWGKPITSVERYGRVVEAVTIGTKGRSTRVNGKAFILATGSFVSGGLYATMDAVEETVFGLPVYVPAPRESWFGDDFFPPDHPIEKAGIVVDESFRPKESPMENLFVCGSILAFSEVMKNGCGHGLAIVTGVAAANSCWSYLQSCEGNSRSCSRIV
jgi:glycerol-3-phosphate dehydrogenase subunit B